MIVEVAVPDVALRCDGCGEVWYFTSDEPLDDSAREEFIEDCLEVLDDTHDHGVPAAPGVFRSTNSTSIFSKSKK